MNKRILVIVGVILFGCFFRFDPISTNFKTTKFYDRWTHSVIVVSNDSNPWAGGIK